MALSTAGCDAAGDNAGSVEEGGAGLVFERKEIADQAGDVKLVGDIDGDGLLDLVLGGMPSEPLSWWHWPDLRRTTIATAATEFTTDGVLADVDGDGDLDIVTADGSDGDNLLWFANPGPDGNPADGAEWTRNEIGAIGSWGKDIKAADFDGDGLTDIVVRAPDEAMIFFLESDGRWTRVGLPPFDLGQEGMAIGDIDGDGDTDLVLHGIWAENPGGAAARESSRWSSYRIGEINPAFKAFVTDINQDGKADVLSSSSEHTADVTWFEPVGGPRGQWRGHMIEPSVPGAHTLQAADMDRDGDTDVVVGQMHTTDKRELAVLYNIDGSGTRWERQIIDNVGLHNGVVADVDRDGDYDIYGANWTGNPPARIWINQLDPSAKAVRIDRWTHHRITDRHVRSFGLSFADMNGDGRTDIMSGPFWYAQPAGDWSRQWEQHRIADGVDAVAAFDLTGDGRAEVFAQAGGEGALKFLWLQGQADGSFAKHPVGEVPAASHQLGSQGHALAQIESGGLPELAASSGGGVFYFKAPPDPASGSWQRVRICADASDEGIAFADMDGDGFLDLVATTGKAREVAWWRNPGDGTADWDRREIGKVTEMVFPDRVAAADFDGDGKMDVVVTEENGDADGAKAYWWPNPGDGSPDWARHAITSRGSLNSLSVADMSGDSKADIVMGEHRGALRLSIWHNLGEGRFVEQLVSKGFESHLGARAVDLDGDGRLDIVSIAWDAPAAIHVWHNDAGK